MYNYYYEILSNTIITCKCVSRAPEVTTKTPNAEMPGGVLSGTFEILGTHGLWKTTKLL